MVKGLIRSLRRGGRQAPTVRVGIPVSGSFTNIDGATGIGWDTMVISDFPAGKILVVAAVLACTLTKTTSGITTTFTGNVSVGSAPTADSTLSGAEVDIIPSTAIGTAVASVSTVYAPSTAASSGVILDNTDGSLEVNLNLLIADAAISADDQAVTVLGTLILEYAVLGA